MKTKFKRSIGLILAAFTGFSLFSCAGAGVQNSSSSGNKNLENEYIEESASTATARWLDGSEFTPVVRFVAAADTHLNEKYVVDSDRRVENLFTDAYKYARSQEYDKLDAVIFCGDVCERGKEKEYINEQSIMYQHKNKTEKQHDPAILSRHDYRIRGSDCVIRSDF